MQLHVLNGFMNRFHVVPTGTGEHVIKTLLAKTCGETLQSLSCPLQGVQATMKENFLGR